MQSFSVITDILFTTILKIATRAALLWMVWNLLAASMGVPPIAFGQAALIIVLFKIFFSEHAAIQYELETIRKEIGYVIDKEHQKELLTLAYLKKGGFSIKTQKENKEGTDETP